MPAPKGNKFAGSRKGKPNKVTADLKDMLRGALVECGGQDYLVEQARSNPSAFLTLLGKTLPKELAGAVEIKFPSSIEVHVLG